jgi:hypothetical protein
LFPVRAICSQHCGHALAGFCSKVSSKIRKPQAYGCIRHGFVANADTNIT